MHCPSGQRRFAISSLRIYSLPRQLYVVVDTNSNTGLQQCTLHSTHLLPAAVMHVIAGVMHVTAVWVGGWEGGV